AQRICHRATLRYPRFPGQHTAAGTVGHEVHLLTPMNILPNIWRQPESLIQVREALTGAAADRLNAAAQLLAGRKRIILTGMGGSLYALMPAATYLASHGILVNLMDAGELLYYGAVPEDCAIVALSRSGR